MTYKELIISDLAAHLFEETKDAEIARLRRECDRLIAKIEKLDDEYVKEEYKSENSLDVEL